MSGGDKTVTHNKIRDDLYLQARKARTAPQHEAVGIARLLGLEVGRETQERPADVLLCRAQDIRTGGSAGAGKVALDVGIVCPQATCHLADASQESLGAAEKYVRAKCSRGDMERRCREVGVTFQPMIFESFGGVSAEAERVIKCLNKAVAVNTDISEEVVATQFWHRVGVDLVRANCRAFHRRLVSHGGDVLGAVGPLGGDGGLQVVEGL